MAKRTKQEETGSIHVALGRLHSGDPNFGLPVECAVCGSEHKGFGVARITSDKGPTTDVPICEPCSGKPDETCHALASMVIGDNETLRDATSH